MEISTVVVSVQIFSVNKQKLIDPSTGDHKFVSPVYFVLNKTSYYQNSIKRGRLSTKSARANVRVFDS